MLTTRLGMLGVAMAIGCGAGEITTYNETSSSRQAIVAKNGLALNGLELNGQAFNGMKFNGLKYNGLKYNTDAPPSSTGESLIGFTRVWLEDSRFHGDLPDGTHVHKRDLDEAVFQGQLARDEGTEKFVTMRIEDINQLANGSDVFLYKLQAWDEPTKLWTYVCPGKHWAIPVSGAWDLSGSKMTGENLFTFACRERGAIGKCIDFGYKPWIDPDRHQACVRMVRADYCGDGQSHTVDGNTINLYDADGIQKDTHGTETAYSWTFEADWTASGAKCTNLANRPGGVSAACYSTLPRCSTTSTALKVFSTGVRLKNWMGIEK